MDTPHPISNSPLFKDLTGRRIYGWTVIGFSGRKSQRLWWTCRCDCGTVREVAGNNLNIGGSKNCGCVRRANARIRIKKQATTHGLSYSRVYRIWKGIITRCTRPCHKHYSLYGGRGITVCERWLAFENFLSDMGMPPEGYRSSIDRINNDGHYEKSNCRWTDQKTQCNNRRTNVLMTYNGVTQTVTQWARALGFNKVVLRNRILRCGWSIEKALTTPIQKQYRH